MNLLHAVILLIIPTAFAFVKRPNITIKPHHLSANFKKGPVYVHTTVSPETRKRNHGLFPQTVTKYVVKTYTPSPYEAKARSENNRMHSRKSSMTKTRALPTLLKFNHLKNKPMQMGLYNKKTKALNEELLRDGIPQISIGLSSEEVYTESNFAEEFNQELLNDMQITENFDDENDPYEGTLRIKGLKHHPHYSNKEMYAESMRSKHPTKYAVKDATRKAELKADYDLKDKIIVTEAVVNMTMPDKPEEAPAVATKVFNDPEPNPPASKFDYLRPKRHSKYYAQDLDDLNKDMEELIFVRRLDNEINVDEVKQKDDYFMEFGKNVRKGI